MADELAAPFFCREETKRQIRDIADSERAAGSHGYRGTPLVIYAGAGVTIDKSGQDWSKLVDGLLEQHIPDAATRAWLSRTHTPLEAASIACQLYEDRFGHEEHDDYQRALIDQLRVLLYGGATWGDGRLAMNLATLALVRHQNRFPTCLVTPNYDDYLVNTFRELDIMPDSVFVEVVRWNDREYRPRRWQDTGELVCFQLHGYVPREKPSDTEYPPVLSERDYLRSADVTHHVLTELFTGSNVLIVGASLTDAPLLRALLDSHPRRSPFDPAVGTADDAAQKGRDRLRLAVIPVQDSKSEGLSGKELATVRLYSLRWFDHFRLTPVYPNFYCQVSQFVQEVVTCFTDALVNGDASTYTRLSSPISYEARLAAWWDDWCPGKEGSMIGYPDEPLLLRQRDHHANLKDILDEVYRLLRAPAGERLKIEAWIRWRPRAERALALWATSEASRSEPESVRREPICLDSNHASVLAYCNGMTTRYEKPADEPGPWRCYLATPIWSLGDDPVRIGVMTLASTNEDWESSLNVLNHARLRYVFALLRGAGRAILGARPDSAS